MNGISVNNISTDSVRLFRRRIMHWYKRNKRRFLWREAWANSYIRIISEVLLRRTRAETVHAFLPVFLQKYPNWRALANADIDELRHILNPLGLAPTRSLALVSLAAESVRRRGKWPKSRKKLESLPGVGQYLASAIMLFCHRMPQPLLDNSMARLIERYWGPRRLVDIRDDPYLQQLSHFIVACDNPALVNWAILDFAASICRLKKPECDICTLRSSCWTWRHDQPM